MTSQIRRKPSVPAPAPQRTAATDASGADEFSYRFYDTEQASLDLRAAEEGARCEAMGEKQLAREIRTLEKRMLEHAKNLEFEQAAALRDQLATPKRRVFGVTLASDWAVGTPSGAARSDPGTPHRSPVRGVPRSRADWRE